MIFKIGRTERTEHEFDDGHSSDYEWEYIERVCNARCKHHFETDSGTEGVLVTAVSYVTETDRRDAVEGVAHATTLRGEDVCYLMNDSGKTIERLR